MRPAPHRPKSRRRRVYEGDYIPGTLPNSRPTAENRRGLPLHDFSPLLNPRPCALVPEGEPGDCAALDAEAAAEGKHECGYPAGSANCRLVCGDKP